MSGRVSDRRIRALIVVFAFLLALALARAAWLQGVESTSLDAQADAQAQRTVLIEPRRGTIFDRNGRELAIGELRTTVFANPREIGDPAAVAKLVAADLRLPEDEVLAKLSNTDLGFVYIARKAEPVQAARLEERGLAGIGFESEERRIYPQRAVASEVVGFAGLDNEGLEGVEAYYDELLSGEAGGATVLADPYGRTIDVLDRNPVREGHDLYLSIDHRLQLKVERLARRARGQWKAQAVTAIVMNPANGAVLAMAVEPGHDPSASVDTDPGERRNRAVTDTYEPGSTFKVVTVAAVLEEGLHKPTSRFTLESEIDVADRTIGEVEGRGTEIMTTSEILARSSNVGTIRLALNLGPPKLDAWIHRFGFGKPTGIDYPGEVEGIVLPRSQWSGSTIANVPIGQGIGVTPVQMAALYSSIANGGKLVKPRLVERVDRRVVEAVKPERSRVIKTKTAKQLTRMLERVVSSGSGTRAQIEGYRVAGKTGTAAKVEPNGEYSTERYVASFVGFAPAQGPRLVVFVAVDEPRGQIFGGIVAAPLFAQIMKAALTHLEVAPSR